MRCLTRLPLPEPDKVAPSLGRRYGDVIDRLSFYTGQSNPEQWRGVMEALKEV